MTISKHYTNNTTWMEPLESKMSSKFCRCPLFLVDIQMKEAFSKFWEPGNLSQHSTTVQGPILSPEFRFIYFIGLILRVYIAIHLLSTGQRWKPCAAHWDGRSGQVRSGCHGFSCLIFSRQNTQLYKEMSGWGRLATGNWPCDVDDLFLPASPIQTKHLSAVDGHSQVRPESALARERSWKCRQTLK